MSGLTSVRQQIGSAGRSPTAPGADGPQRRDVVLVSLLIAAALLEGSLRTDLTWRIPAIAVVVLLLPGLLWRRSRPLLVVATTTVATAAFTLAQEAAGVGPDALGTTLAFTLLPYALFRWGSGRDRGCGGALLALGLALSVALGDGAVVENATAGVVFVGGACLIGAFRRERVASRRRELEAARSAEREGLARDLHDTVAHHVSAIAIHAQAGGAVPGDPERAARAFAVIEREAQAVLTDMRSLVQTWRSPADYQPTSGWDDLALLASDGPPPVTVAVDGGAQGPGTAVPDVVAATAFRIAQEGVTNARRHARGASGIEVTVTADRSAVSLVVHDDGAPAGPAPRDGHGLRGVVERAALLGGAASAGPDPGGGWTLRASLPLGGGS